MSEIYIENEVESLMAQIMVDNQIDPNNHDDLKYLPFGEEFLSHIFKCALPKNDEFELRKLFKDMKKKKWNLIKARSGKAFCEEYKEYKNLFLFEFCRNNYGWSSYRTSDGEIVEKSEELKLLIEIICQSMGDVAKKLVKEMVSWHKNNSKNNQDLVDFIFYDEFNFKRGGNPKHSFIGRCPGLIERITTNIWGILNDKEKTKFSFEALYYFGEQINSLKDINLKSELEKYFDNDIMKQLNIESREQRMLFDETTDENFKNYLKEQHNGILEGNTLKYTIGKFKFGRDFFDQAVRDKNEAINKFVFRKIGYHLFINDNANDDESIDYIINVESNKNFYSRLAELEKIDTNTDADFIWKIICSLRSDDDLNKRIENVFLKRNDLVEMIGNAKIHFSENFKNEYIGIDKKIAQLFSIKTEKALDKILELLKKIPNDTDMFSIIRNSGCGGYETVLIESRKLRINELLRKEFLQQENADKLIAMAENKETNYYAWSDDEIKKCLLSETDFILEILHANLEPELMVRIFEISILLVVKYKHDEKLHDEKYLLEWKESNDLYSPTPFVVLLMLIFHKSYADRPSIWAKHLIKIAEEWNGSENMLIRICFALGHLREPLGGKVPISLQKIADRQENDSVKKRILTQRNLFNRESFNKGHHKNPSKRVEHCKEELIEAVKCKD